MLIVHVTNTDPAGSIINFVRAMNAYTNHRVRLITTQKIQQFDFPRDILDQYDGGDELIALLEKADVIHFHKVKEDFSFNLELARGIRTVDVAEFVNGKKLVYHLHGAPHERNMPESNAAEYVKRNAVVLASTPDLEEVYRMFGVNVRYFPNVVPIDDVRYLPRATNAPIIGADGVTKRYCVFQSGTNSILKNMHVIREVMDKLAVDLPVFFLHTSPENIQTQDFALRHKRIAHAVFDHIEGYYGLSSLEALSMGKPTIAGLTEYTMNAIQRFFGIERARLPWIVARNGSEIERELRRLFAPKGGDEVREWIGLTSRKFMENVWSDRNVARRMAEFYESL